MLGIFVSNFMKSFPLLRIKICIDCTPVCNYLPVTHNFKIHRHTQNYCGAEPMFFFIDDFGRLMGNEPLFRGVRFATIDPFFIRCDNSPDKSIIHGITDNLSTDIHSMFNLLRCQFMRYRSTASVWFSKCLNQAMYGIFRCTKFFWQPTSRPYLSFNRPPRLLKGWHLFPFHSVYTHTHTHKHKHICVCVRVCVCVILFFKM